MRKFLILAIVLAGLSTLSAQVPEPAREPPVAKVRAGSAAAISFQSEKKLRAAFEHLYNLEFTPARRLFEEVAEAEPESATVCAYWASALLYELLAHQGSLQSQLFVTTNEFLRHQRAPVEPELDRQFHTVATRVEERAERRLAANPNDADALFGLGLVYGSRANYLAGVKAEYLAAVRLGEKAYDTHNRLRKLRPEVHDTSVVLGVREYVIGNLPKAARFLLLFLGARGSRDEGLGFFQDAARHGEFLRTYAEILLTVVYIREEKPDSALEILKSLQARYPRNPIFLVELAKLHRQQKRYADAARASHALLTLTTGHPHNPRIVGPEDALLQLGLIQADQDKFEIALDTLEKVEEVDDADKRIHSMARLERGKILDRLGQREQALALYKGVTDLAADARAVQAANRYKRKPYQPGKDN
jgi:tetratricopeptide (TPR) repeat protein